MATFATRFHGTWWALAVVLALISAACGGSTVSTPPTQSSGGVSEAKAIVSALSGAATFSFKGPSITVGDKLKGKRIYAIGNGLKFFFVQNWLSGVKEAAKALGMTVTAVDASANDPAGLIEQGVAQGYDVILLQSVDSATMAAPLADAKAAKIPVIELTTSDPQLPTSDAKARGIFGYVTFCYSCAGKQMAAFVVADGGEGARAVIYTVPGLVVSESMVRAFQSEVARLCSTCSVKVINAPFAQWGNLQTLTGTAIEGNADAKHLYLIPVFDAMVPIGVAAAVAEKGLGASVKIVTYNGTDAGLPGVADGTVAADIGGPQVWLGWATVDQVARALTGADATLDEMLPHRIFSSVNIKTVDLHAAEDTWYGGTGFRAEYKKLWGLAS
jgi:ABC-type sugar transport system substrate-binding protein